MTLGVGSSKQLPYISCRNVILKCYFSKSSRDLECYNLTIPDSTVSALVGCSGAGILGSDQGSPFSSVSLIWFSALA